MKTKKMSKIKDFFLRVGAIARREMKIIFTRPIYLFSMIGAPVFAYLFFLSLMGKGLPTDLPVAVVDLDRSAVSRNIVRQLDAFQQTQVEYLPDDFTQARTLMQEGKVYGIMLIPEGFSQQVGTSSQPSLSFYTNNAYLIAGSLLFRDMKMMSELAAGAAGRQVRLAKGQTLEEAMGQLQPIVIDTHAIGNPWLNYSVYLCNVLLPGVLALMIMLVTVYGIGSEIKRHQAREWLRMAGGNFWTAITGKLLPQTGVFLLMGYLCLALLYRYMEFPMNSSIWAMIVAMTLLVLASQGLGVFMIGVLPNVRLGLSFASLWGVISFSISGFTFPVAAMDPTLQALANLFPLRHYFLIYADQALNGYGIYYSIVQYLSLAAFIFLPLLIARPLKVALFKSRYQL